ncbi:MAG: rod shape-determining protein MreD [Acidiferrobacter sp.]
MDHLRPRQIAVIMATFVIAMLLAIMPMPASVQLLRPDWVALVLAYWCLAIPDRVGVGSGWLVGLALDGLYGSLLGEQALAKALLAYLTLHFYLRLRMFPRWQQALAIGGLIGVSDLVVLMIRSLVHGAPPIWSDTAPMVANVLLWPFVFVILREVRRRAKIS